VVGNAVMAVSVPGLRVVVVPPGFDEARERRLGGEAPRAAFLLRGGLGCDQKSGPQQRGFPFEGCGLIFVHFGRASIQNISGLPQGPGGTFRGNLSVR
jgi:hypothetical protein